MQLKKFPKAFFTQPAAIYGGAAATVFGLSAVGTITENTTAVTYFSSVAIDFGPPDATRVLAALIVARNPGTYNNISSVTFSTTPGSFSQRQVTGSVNGAELWYAAVPAGSSGVVTVVYSGTGQARAAMQLFSVMASTGGPSATAVSTGSNLAAANITIPAGGAALAGAFSQAGAPTTFTGTPANFSNVDLNWNPTGAQIGYWMHSSAGAVVGSTTLSMTLASSAGSTIAAVFSSWGP